MGLSVCIARSLSECPDSEIRFDLYIGIQANFRIVRTLATFDFWCRSGFEIRYVPYIDNDANYETTTPVFDAITK